MYAIAIVRYVKPLEEVLKHQDPHRAYLKDLKAKGTLLASGPLEPRYGGALLLRIPDAAASAYAALAAVRDGDPFVKAQVAQYELLPWLPNIGVESLDRL
ncbi:MAG TPA: YciI family protein [Anaeromyxobacter sp.]